VNALWLVLAAAASFAAGHYRIPGHIFEWAYDQATAEHARHSPGWWFGETVAAVMLLGAFLFTPRRAIRNIHSWREADKRVPAPLMTTPTSRREPHD